jgi:hypothetical protein
MATAKRLGKKLKIGDTFFSPTKRMIKKCYTDLYGPFLKVLQPGDKMFFTKGKRRYYCAVIGIAETRTGVYAISASSSIRLIDGKPKGSWHGRRWWQFTYLVKILEN